MPVFERYRQTYLKTPPSASGRTRHDPTLGLAGAALSGIFASTAAVRRIRPPSGGADTMTLNVARRRVVAHDQDVIELTLTAARGRTLPAGIPVRIATPPAQRPGPAVLAVRRPVG